MPDDGRTAYTVTVCAFGVVEVTADSHEQAAQGVSAADAHDISYVETEAPDGSTKRFDR